MFHSIEQVLGFAYIVRMVKFQFLAQFSVDPVAHPVVSSLTLFLRKFAAFAHYLIDRLLLSFLSLLYSLLYQHMCVFLPLHIHLLSQSLYLSFLSNFPSRFCISLRFPKGKTDFITISFHLCINQHIYNSDDVPWDISL